MGALLGAMVQVTFHDVEISEAGKDGMDTWWLCWGLVSGVVFERGVLILPWSDEVAGQLTPVVELSLYLTHVSLLWCFFIVAQHQCLLRFFAFADEFHGINSRWLSVL